MNPNRAILLTPPGAAAIAVIRIRGGAVDAFLRDYFAKPATPLRCVHGELRDAGRTIDDPIIVLHEDAQTADINLHGGPWVVAATFELLRRSGFEIVEEDAELLDGQTTLEKEMHAALPLARTEEALRMLLAQPAAWREFVASQPQPDQIRRVLDDPCLWRLLHPPRVAIVGPPNVGKSTLANQLFAQQRSITADLPGTTRDYVGEIANVNGLPVMLFDTPGLRQSHDSIEREATRRADDVIRHADLLLVVREPFQERGPQAEHLSGAPNAINVLNKVDRSHGDADSNDACTVATTGEGIDALQRRIRFFFGCDDLTAHRARCWTDRQRAILNRATEEPAALKEIYSTIRAMSW